MWIETGTAPSQDLSNEIKKLTDRGFVEDCPLETRWRWTREGCHVEYIFTTEMWHFFIKGT